MMLTAQEHTSTTSRRGVAAGGRPYPAIALSTHHWRPERHHSGVVTYAANLVDGIQQLHTPVYVVANQGGADAGESFVRRVPAWQELEPKVMDWLIAGAGRRLAPAHTRSWMMARRLLHVLDALHREHGVELFETEESCGVARLVARHSPVPVVVRVHGPWFLVGPAAGAVRGREYERRVRAEGLAFTSAAGLSAPSRDVLQRIRDHYGLPFNDAVVIPNPVKLVPRAERWSLAACDADRLLFVGRFDRAKGADVVLDAFARVLHRRPATRLAMVGSDEGLVDDAGSRVHAQNYIARVFPDRADASRVEWLGLKSPEEIVELRRRCFAAVVASRYESFSLTTLEAMAAGSPVVASDVGGVPEIVKHGHNGLLFRAADASDLAVKLLQLMDRSEWAAKLGEQAATDASRDYSPVAIARRTLEFHRETLDRLAIRH